VKRSWGSQVHRRGAKPAAGYTLIEFVVTAAILMTVASIAIFQLRPTVQDQQANAGMDQVKTTLRQARETAISQRRSIVVSLVAAGTAPCTGKGFSNCIELFQMVVSGTTETQASSPYLTIPIENGVSFGTYSGETDTPDGFGIPSSGGVMFNSISGGPSGMRFQSTGTFTDSTGSPINGSVFLVYAGVNNSARAVTVLGNTGRIRSYRNSTSGWFQ
jgi:Tfp pilus assembly protein FimT